MSDFWVLPEAKVPSPVTVPFPVRRLLPSAFKHMAHTLDFLTFDRETKHFAHKMLTYLNWCRLPHMSRNGNHLENTLRIDTNINSRDGRQNSLLPTHTRTQIQLLGFVHRHHAVQQKSMIRQKCKAENMNLLYKQMWLQA